MLVAISQKNPRAHKNKIGTSPPQKKNQNTPPPLKRGILWTWLFFLQKERIFPGAHRIGAAISGPRIAGRNFDGREDFSEKIVSQNFSLLVFMGYRAIIQAVLQGVPFTGCKF